MNKTTELYYLKREIKTNGQLFLFERKVLDEYGEDTKQTEQVAEIKGIFHIEKGYISKNISDGSSIRTKGQPKILMLYDDSLILRNNDFLMIDGQKFVITEKNNISMFGIVCDLSLEVVLDGTN